MSTITAEQLLDRMTPEQVQALIRNKDTFDAMAARTSLAEFVKQAWQFIEPSTELIWGPEHDAICLHLQAVSERKIKNLAISIPPGTLKPCAVEGLVIEKSKGSVPLGDIEVGDHVLTHKGRFRKVLAVHEQGVLPLLEIVTARGRVIRVERSHGMLTTRGWVEAGDLVPGDCLAHVNKSEPCGSETVTLEEARFLGYLIGDGHVKNNGTSFTNGDDACIEDFVACASSLGFGTNTRRLPKKTFSSVRVIQGGELPRCPNHPDRYGTSRSAYCKGCHVRAGLVRNGKVKKAKSVLLGASSSHFRADRVDECQCGGMKRVVSKKCYTCSGSTLTNGELPGYAEPVGQVRQWRIRRGIDGKCSYTKRVPEVIMRGTDAIVIDFLAAYWSCDGTIVPRLDIQTATGKARTTVLRICCDTVSEHLARDIHALLARLGISATVRRKCYSLRTNKQGEQYVSWMVAMEDQDNVAKFAEIVAPRIFHKKKAKADGLKRQDFDRTLIPDAVKSVSEVNPGECRCLSVEEDSTFSYQGVAVHNSTLTSVCWPAFHWLQWPADRFLTASYSNNLALRDSVRSRRLIDTEWYQRCKATNWQLTSDQNLKERYENDKTGYRITTSVKGTATGDRAHFTLIDDPHNVTEAESTAVREQTKRWHNEAFFNRINNAKLGGRVVVGQRVHHDDLIGMLLKMPGWVELRIPERYEADRPCITPIGWKDWRTTEGEWLRPQRFGPEQEEEVRAVYGSFGWNAQHQQRPTPREGALFKAEWFQKRFYREGDFYHIPGKQSVNQKHVWRFAVLDPAGGTSDRADYSVIGIFAVAGTDLLIEQIFRERVPLEGIPSWLKKTCDEWKPRFVGIETFFLQSRIAKQARMMVGMPPIRNLDKATDKRARAIPALIRAENGQLLLPEKGKWIEAFLDELMIFTGINDTHDDQVDALSWGCELMQSDGAGDGDFVPYVRPLKAFAG